MHTLNEHFSTALMWYAQEMPSPFEGKIAIAKYEQQLVKKPLPVGTQKIFDAKAQCHVQEIQKLCAFPPAGYAHLLAAGWLGTYPTSAHFHLEVMRCSDESLCAFLTDTLGQFVLDSLLQNPKGARAFLLAQPYNDTLPHVSSYQNISGARRRSDSKIKVPDVSVPLEQDLLTSASNQMQMLRYRQKRALVVENTDLDPKHSRLMQFLQMWPQSSAFNLNGTISSAPAVVLELQRVLDSVPKT